MLKPRSALRSHLVLLLLTVLLLGCASSSTPSPVQPPPVRPPEIPAPPAVTKPPPSGTYLARYCATIEQLSTRLKITLPESERCSAPGQPR